MYVIMSNYFQSSLINDPAVTIFVLCTLAFFQPSSCVLKKEHKYQIWKAVSTDLELIFPKFNATSYTADFDATLYTADLKDFSDCNLSVVKCFQLEMEVILYELKFENDAALRKKVDNIIQNVKFLLEYDKQETKTSKWQQCETFAEKNGTEFLKSFKTIAQRCYTELNAK
ncbi:interleukin-15 isoform X2 [Zootoca vivipara]|uniref:interleukin-15 isoform X2 n=1 Tax=Zootoca vivipara TaxID=8524 RepID=UPI001591AAAE|nr:interleukin-15 isoform X2 [Zootoca vivipara]XP_060134610.1 interleukin-15 isoform X2 [Zootoca vivipara]XP_060134611.1 interleukin-15 isoform X2 [Zootoca vivipara]